MAVFSFRTAAVVARRFARDSHLARGQLLFAVLALSLAPAAIAPAQDKPPQNEDAGRQGLLLVAHRELSDPFFAKSAVLMLPVDLLIQRSPPVKGAVGLIINKPTHVALHTLFPDVRDLQKQDATAYFGGPVDIHDRSAIFRSPTPPEHALHIFADVYVTFDSDVISAVVKKNAKQASSLRIFLGRSQWSRPQLQNEMSEGAWYSLPGDAPTVFASDPGKVWQALLERVEPRPYVEYRTPASGAPDFGR